MLLLIARRHCTMEGTRIVSYTSSSAIAETALRGGRGVKSPVATLPPILHWVYAMWLMDIAFVTFRENMAPVTTTGLGLLNAIFTFKGTSPTNHFCRDSWANESLTTLSLTVFTERNLLGATSENRSKIGDFAPTRSVWPKISDWRWRPLQ